MDKVPKICPHCGEAITLATAYEEHRKAKIDTASGMDMGENISFYDGVCVGIHRAIDAIEEAKASIDKYRQQE
jgi:hypothetical protein